MATIRSIPVILKTQTSYVIPSEKYMIPTTWRRFHLSQLINKVLNLPRPVPFDFIAQGDLLTASLGDWCLEKGVGEEETLEIEYIESVLPPEKVSSIPHPDWVSSISCQLKGHFLTGSYDNTVRLYNDRQELLYSMSEHTAPVSSVCVIPPNPDAMEPLQLVASASYDTTARIFALPDPATSSAGAHQQVPATLASLHLHTSKISSIVANRKGTQLLTTGWDNIIGVWSTTVPDEDEVPEEVPPTDPLDRKKRRKVNGAAVKRDTTAPKRKAPTNVLKSHSGRISSACFSPLDSEPNVAYSCGWDFTVRTWDVEVGLCTNTRTVPERAMLDVAVTSTGKSLVTANADRTISVFAVSDNQVPPLQLPHTAPVTSIVAHPTSPYHIASGCMDGTVRIWDLRSTKGAMERFVATGSDTSDPGVKTLPSKVLSLDWSENLIGCAGELGVDIFRASVGN